MMKLRKNQKGFTLIEVLLIVVILGIIAAIAIPRLMASRAEAQLQTCRTNVANLNTAIEKYYFDTGLEIAAGTALVGSAIDGADADGNLYMPDGVPVNCPDGTSTYAVNANKRAACSTHGDIYGTGAGT